MTNYEIQYEESQHRVMTTPIGADNRLDIHAILRRIKAGLKWDLNTIAEYTALPNANAVFRVMYCDNDVDIIARLNEYLIIDPDTGKAYLYHHEHKPSPQTPIPHVSVKIKNLEVGDMHVLEKHPSLFATRITIADPLDRILTLTVSATNAGIVLDAEDEVALTGASYVVRGRVKKLNKILNQLKVVGTTPGQSTVSIKVDDGEGDDASVVSATYDITIDAAPKISTPVINVTSPQEIKLNTYTEIKPAITITDDDNKTFDVKFTPRGCRLLRFRSHILPVLVGDTKVITGDPKYINTEIAKLAVYAESKDAGFNIVVERTDPVIRVEKYYAFTVTDATEPEEPVEPEEPEDNTLDITYSNQNVSGNQGSEIPLGVTFSGNRKEQFTLTLTPNNCKLKDMNSSPSETGSAHTFKGTIATVNQEISSAKIVVGESSGKIDISTDAEISGTITVTTTPAVPVSLQVPKSAKQGRTLNLSGKKRPAINSTDILG